MFFRLAGGLVLGSLLMGATGCVSTAEYKSLQTNLQEAQRQIAEMQSDILGLRKHISDLEAQIAAKDELLGKLKGGDSALLKERDLLAAELAAAKKKLNELLALGAGKPILDEPINNALRDLAAMYPDLLEFDEKLGMIRFKSDMTFDLGSTDVKPRAKDALKVLAGILNRPEIAKHEIRVVGHTDDVPIKVMAGKLSPDNWYLSTNRAHAVLAVLRGDGVSEARGQAAGWGEQRPIGPNAPGHKGSEKNRRVEVYILPTETPDVTISSPAATKAAPAPKAPASAPAGNNMPG
jgi:flagellar motor protein MotB